MAEESTAWPQVTRPTDVGGLGFSMKWNMGWMHDTLDFISRDPVYRRYHHNNLTFSLVYAFNENFILPLSHDEVVHLKGSLIKKMPGDDWQKAANLRAYYGYMYGHPGKKLLFMGDEIAQWHEWNFEASLDWYHAELNPHRGVAQFLRDLNHLYQAEPALHEVDFEHAGFQWIDYRDADQSIIAFLRRNRAGDQQIIVICNFTPIPRENYHLGVPEAGFYAELINSDAISYWGSGMGNLGGVQSQAGVWHDQPHHIKLVLPPLSTLILKRTEKG